MQPSLGNEFLSVRENVFVAMETPCIRADANAGRDVAVRAEGHGCVVGGDARIWRGSGATEAEGLFDHGLKVRKGLECAWAGKLGLGWDQGSGDGSQFGA